MYSTKLQPLWLNLKHLGEVFVYDDFNDILDYFSGGPPTLKINVRSDF